MSWNSLLLVAAVLLGCADQSRAQSAGDQPMSVATVFVPTVAVQLPAGTARIPGQYAAMVASGGWKLHAKTQGLACSLWEYDVSVTTSYQAAMHDVLKRVLGAVDFFDMDLTSDQIKRMGLNALLTITQNSAVFKLRVTPGPANAMKGAASSEIDLTADLAIMYPNGAVYLQTIYGKGLAEGPVVTCDDIKNLTSQAAQQAILDIANDLALFVRAGL